MSNDPALDSSDLDDALMRLPEVNYTTKKSRSTIYRDMSKGTFPKPIKIGPRAVAWLRSDIRAWKQAKINASRRGA